MTREEFFIYTNPLYWLVAIPFFIIKLILKRGYVKDLIRLYKFKRIK